MGRLMSDERLEPNGVDCFDCSTIYDEAEECPEEPQQHSCSPVHISDVALGRDDDDDNYHHGLKKWVYDCE